MLFKLPILSSIVKYIIVLKDLRISFPICWWKSLKFLYIYKLPINRKAAIMLCCPVTCSLIMMFHLVLCYPTSKDPIMLYPVQSCHILYEIIVCQHTLSCVTSPHLIISHLHRTVSRST